MVAEVIVGREGGKEIRKEGGKGREKEKGREGEGREGGRGNSFPSRESYAELEGLPKTERRAVWLEWRIF